MCRKFKETLNNANDVTRNAATNGKCAHGGNRHSLRCDPSLDVGAPVERHQIVYARQYDRFSLEPGNGVWWRLAGVWSLPSNARVSLEPWYQEQHLADSASVTLTRGGVAQPFQAYQPQSV